MKNLILCLCISFYCVGTLSAQSDSLITVLEKTLQVQIDALGKEHLDVAMYCDSLGMMYMKAGKYAQADSLFSKAFDIKSKKLEENHPDIADSYHKLGEVCRYKGNYPEAETLYTKTLNIYLEVYGEKHFDVGESYNSLGIINYITGDYEKAISFYNKALNIWFEIFDEKNINIAKSYNNLGVVYEITGDYEKAISFYDKALDIGVGVLGEKHPNIAKLYANLGVVYYFTGDYDKAISFSNKALNIRLDVFGEKHSEVTDSYNNLGFFYDEKCDYEKAISFHNKALNIRLDLFGEKHPELINSYNNLGKIYHKTGDYEKAISFHNKALNIGVDVLGERHPNVIKLYNNLGVVYHDTGNYEKAISFYNKALNIALEVYGEKHHSVYDSYQNLGNIHYDTDNHKKAISFYNKALNIALEVFGEKHSDVALPHNALGNIYYDAGNYEKAISFYNKALNIALEVFGEKHSGTAGYYSNLGDVYREMGDYEKAIRFHNKALNIRLELFGEKHPDITDSYGDLAVTYDGIGEYQTADSLWHIVINQNIKRLNDTYLFLPDNQRLEYAKTFKEVHDEFLSFTVKHGNENTKKLVAYLLLNTKSLALDYAVSVRELINNIGNEELRDLHNKANKLNGNISQAELMTAEERKEKNWDLTAMRDEQENLNRQLLKDEALKGKLYKNPITWKNVQSKLKSNEAMLDFVRFYEESDSTWMYYAMLTRKNMSAPEFIRVTDEGAITELLQADNQAGQPNCIQIDGGLKTLYQKIWQPLNSYFKGIKTVHVSPAGLLHQVDFDVLQDENEKYLAEHFEFHYYTTMRDFTEKKRTNFLSNLFKKNQYKNAVLLGDIAYDLSPEKELGDDTINIALRDGVTPLPATGEEINEINEIVENKGGSSIRIRGNNATENAIQHHTGDQSSHIFHFATHGKYLSPFDSLGTQATLQDRLNATGNPLQRSMLMLSGANDTWTSKEYISRADNDGIFTAYEVTHLDLSTTKLVVLSACNTGLGDIHDTEGVLGLQSAFKLAGVEHVVVSLWKVNDAATKELMVTFYKNLLNKKQNAPTALRNAKAEMRQNGAKPANWAGFILIE